MKLEVLLGYLTIREKVKVKNYDTNEIIYEGNVIVKPSFEKDYKVAYFKALEKDYILVEVYEEEEVI